MANFKKILIILFIVFLFFFLADLSFAQRELEVPIPGMTTTPFLPEYIVGIYNFALMIIGIVVFGALVYGGFRYLTSAGNPAAIADAKDQIFSALLGLIILFSSWVILNTINPELVIIGEPGEPCIVNSDCELGQECIGGRCTIGPMPGAGEPIVAAYRDENYQGDMCNITRTGNIEDLCGAGWNETISSVKIENPNYVVILHRDVNYAEAQLIETSMPKLNPDMDTKTSSVTLIKKTPSTGKATLYDNADYQTSYGAPADYLQSADFSSSHPNFTEINYGGQDFNNRVSSIALEKEVIAILYNYINYKGQARVVAESDTTFDTCDAEDWCPNCAETFAVCRCGGCPARCIAGDSCWNDKPSSIQIVNGYIVTTTMVYEDADYGGSSLAVTGDIPDLTALGWNDRISSIRVERGATIVIWSDANYTGTSRTITADDRTFDPRQDAPFCLGFWDPADLCPGCGTAGCCLLLDECWNDKVSSIDVQ